jgi:acetyltransferase-like isoleucine patch superfamily enzyme
MKMIKEILSALCVVLPSFVTCIIYRMLGHRIGRNAAISIFSYVHAEEIEIGNDVEIRPFVFIRVSQLSVGANSIISIGTQIKGHRSFVTKGNNFVGVHCVINCEEDVKMGFYSGLGPRCIVYTHGSFLPVTRGYPAKFGMVVLEDYVWVGMAVTILPGTFIESNCIINPGVVLKSRIKSNTLIECSPTAFREMDLRRLQRLLQNKISPDYCKEIIRDFLAYFRLDYVYDQANNCFSTSEDVFRCFPERNLVELSHRGNSTVRYDLSAFSADPSDLKIHRKFLFYLRRRCGIILTVNY